MKSVALHERLVAAAFVALSCTAWGGTAYVNPLTGNDNTAQVDSPTLKFKTVQTAIDSCGTGGTVMLDAGTYEITTALALKNGVSLIGTGWTNCVIKQKTNGQRVVSMDTSSPTLCGVTVTGGRTTAGWQPGSGVNMQSGTISWCCISNNTATGFNIYGAGVYIVKGTIDHSIIAYNAAYQTGLGGGIGCHDAAGAVTLDTCLIYGNSHSSGGGAIACEKWSTLTIRNTTIAKNTSAGVGGGLHRTGGTVVLVNSIVADNTSGSGDANVSGTLSANSSCTLFGNGTTAVGAGSKSGSAQFKSLANNDFHLLANSDAVGLGGWYEGIPDDLDGKARGEKPSAGCYEYDSASEPFSCVIDKFAAEALRGEEVTFSASAVNPPEGQALTYNWRLTDQFDHVESFSGNPAKVTLPAGTYSVAVQAVAEGGKASDLCVAEDSIQIGVLTNYVTSVENPGAEFPYDEPAKATHSIHEALDAAINGSTVVLDAGAHPVASAISLAKAVTIIGAGRDLTSITRTSGSFQMMSINNAEACIRDLTLEGASYNGGTYTIGCALLITLNGGKALDCGIRSATVGGLRCAASAVYLDSDAALVDRCVIACCTNTAKEVENSDASIYGRGGAIVVSRGAIRNSLVTRCVSTGCAGIIATNGGTIDNCTVVANEMNGTTETSSAVYLRGGAVRNCIIADNVSKDQTEDSSLHGKPNWYGKTKGDTDSAKNCCWFGSTATGIDSTNVDPEFVAPDAGDWRVKAQTPIRNLGLPLKWMTAESVDFAGNPRMRGKHVTPGCYDAGKIGLVIFIR